jgi:hypothetical protein
MRKFTASVLIAITLWGSFVAPARAFVPLLYPMAVGSVTTAEGTIALSAVASTATVGSIIALVAMTTDKSPPASNGSNVALQVQLDTYTPLPTPQSASAPETSPYVQQEVVVNEVIGYYEAGSPSGANYGYSASDACNKAVTAVNAYFSGSWSVQNCSSLPVGTNGSWRTNTNANGYYSGGLRHFGGSCYAPSVASNGKCVVLQDTCPSGYTLNTTTQSCNRNSTDVQVPDQKTQITRTANTLQKNPNDPDPLPSNVTVSPQEVVIKALDSKTNIKINPDGSSEIIVIERGPNDSTKESKLQLSAPSPGSSPTVTGKQVNTIPGQENGPDGEPVLPGEASGTPSAPAGSTNVLNLPANLAKTEKQCGYDEDHKCTTDVKESVEKLVNEDASLAGQKATVQNKINDLETDAAQYETDSQDTLSTLTSSPLDQHGITWEWFPELPTAQCSTFQYGAGTHVYTWDFCPVVVKIRDILGYVLYIGTAISLLYIALGRKAE